MMPLPRIFAAVLALLACAGGAAAETADHSVRFVYLVSEDRAVREEYVAAIESAAVSMQGWFADRLEGSTFKLNSSVVEIARSAKPAAWFYSHPNGTDKENWGYNNTLAEAARLLGARTDDPNWIWVIYSDGPGNKGRGGSGVACLPEDDLLGLTGAHPKQKNRRRWVAGMGHELGHALGLDHPKDQVKDHDALMWAGVYSPGKAYLTEQDKIRLKTSPFIFDAEGRSGAETAPVFERLAYAGGAFERIAARDWIERKSDGTFFRFDETEREQGFILLNDEGRGYRVRLPAAGGSAEISFDRGNTWRFLYAISPRPGSAP